MTNIKQNIREQIIKTILSVAPEIEFETVNPDLPLRDQVDIDSMDFINIIVGIHKTLGIDIPESDYARLSTLNSFVDYINEKINQ